MCEFLSLACGSSGDEGQNVPGPWQAESARSEHKAQWIQCDQVQHYFGQSPQHSLSVCNKKAANVFLDFCVHSIGMPYPSSWSDSLHRWIPFWSHYYGCSHIQPRYVHSLQYNPGI